MILLKLEIGFLFIILFLLNKYLQLVEALCQGIPKK